MATVRMPDGEELTKDNSNQARAERNAEEKKNPITKGVMRHKTLAMKFAEVFFEGSLKDAVDYVINDLAIPQLKNAVIKGIEVIFYGGVNGSSSSRGSSGNSNVPYSSYWVGRDGAKRPNAPSGPGPRKSEAEIQKLKKNFDPKLIVVEDRGMAQRVLADLRNDCNEYGQVEVRRLFELVGIDSDWTSSKYGWVRGDLDDAKVRPCGTGWWFDVPDPYPID